MDSKNRDYYLKEIELLRKKIEENNPDDSEKAIEYYKHCWDCALAMLEVFDTYGHSGYSSNVTVDIFKKLAQYTPLTKLTDDDNEWNDVTPITKRPKNFDNKDKPTIHCTDIDGSKVKDFVCATGEELNKTKLGRHPDIYKTLYQNNRKSSVFKTINYDNSVSYSDVNRIICYDPKKGEDDLYSCSLMTTAFDEKMPIKMPYMPVKIHVPVIKFYTDFNDEPFDLNVGDANGINCSDILNDDLTNIIHAELYWAVYNRKPKSSDFVPDNAKESSDLLEGGMGIDEFFILYYKKKDATHGDWDYINGWEYMTLLNENKDRWIR